MIFFSELKCLKGTLSNLLRMDRGNVFDTLTIFKMAAFIEFEAVTYSYFILISSSNVIKFLNPKPQELQNSACNYIVDLS